MISRKKLFKNFAEYRGRKFVLLDYDARLILLIKNPKNLSIFNQDFKKYCFTSYPDYSAIFIVNDFDRLDKKNKAKLIQIILKYVRKNTKYFKNYTNIIVSTLDFNNFLEEVKVKNNDKFLAALLSSALVRPNIDVENFVKLLENPLSDTADLYSFKNYALECKLVDDQLIDSPSFDSENDFNKFLKLIDHIFTDRIIDHNGARIISKMLPSFSVFFEVFEANGGFELDKEKALHLFKIIDVKKDVIEFRKYYSRLVDKGIVKVSSIKDLLYDSEYVKCSNIVDSIDSLVLKKDDNNLSNILNYRLQKYLMLFSYYLIIAIENDSLDAVYDLVSLCFNDNTGTYVIALLDNNNLRSSIDYYLRNYDGTPLEFYLDIEGVYWGHKSLF